MGNDYDLFKMKRFKILFAYLKFKYVTIIPGEFY